MQLEHSPEPSIAQDVRPSIAPDARSFMLLTIHKAGSTYVGEIFKEVFAKHGYGIVDPLTEAFDRGVRLGPYIKEQTDRLCAPKSFIGPFRGRLNGLAAHLISARPIVHVRDPRDCIVSYYYSLRFSHVEREGLEGARIRARRESLEHITIDGFVENILLGGKEVDDDFSRSFELLENVRRAWPDAILSRYEDMVEEFPDWLVGVVEQFGIDIDYEMIIDLIARTDFLQNLRVEENQYNHKRQITPGDFRRKLTPRSQALLTEFYAQELAWFGYA